MKETPLLMCGSMVVATLEGRKGQTRRILNPQPVLITGLDSPRRQNHGDLFLAPDIFPTGEIVNGKITGNFVFAYAEGAGTTHCMGMVEFCRDHCPYGQPGDRIWVKETHLRWGRWVRNGKTKKGKPAWKFRPAAPNLKKVLYVAGEPVALPEKIKRTELAWHKRPSIFMPRWASRLTLEITDVRVERVQSITEADAIAEGISKVTLQVGKHSNPQPFYRAFPDKPGGLHSAKSAYEILWDSLNKKRGFGWDENPWVWKICFKRIKPTGG